MKKPPLPAPGRKPWIRPVVERIAAGQAESGTRTTSDTQFNFS